MYLYIVFVFIFDVLTLLVKVDAEVTVMKRYSTFPKAPGLEPHHQIA